MQRFGDVCLARVRAEHEAPHPAAVAELGAVGPLLDRRRGDVVPPTTPVVPGGEDRHLWPQARRNHRLDLADRPLAALAHVALARGSLSRGVGGMLALGFIGV